jgi:ribosomal-protein-alanine N-acetyltransferase
MTELKASCIVTTRLELPVLGPMFLARSLAADTGALDELLGELAFSDPAGFLVGAHDVVRLRLQQLEAKPDVGAWLLRALVLRDQRIAIGFIGFHAEPDERGMVEIGYEVLPQFRRCGLASEAVAALIDWAAREGVSTVRASVGPENRASLALIARQGFVQVGEQIDEVDGRELVFEKRVGDRGKGT